MFIIMATLAAQSLAPSAPSAEQDAVARSYMECVRDKAIALSPSDEPAPVIAEVAVYACKAEMSGAGGLADALAESAYKLALWAVVTVRAERAAER